jgi:hypothetical protein
MHVNVSTHVPRLFQEIKYSSNKHLIHFTFPTGLVFSFWWFVECCTDVLHHLLGILLCVVYLGGCALQSEIIIHIDVAP